MPKTIKQLADELGVSKTAIRKHMTEDFRSHYTKTNGSGVITIDSAGCRLIAFAMGRELVSDVPDEQKPSEIYDNREEIALLREQLTVKDEQLAAKDRQIEALTTALNNTISALENTTSALNLANESLHAAQALHAGTIQQQLEAHGEEVQVLQEEHEQPRRWWQFWK